MYLPEAAQIESFLFRELQKHFSKSLVDISKRVRLIPDLYKYKVEDPYFFAQAKGKIPQHYSIYFDDEFVCTFDSSYLPEAVLLMFWRGLTELYKNKKIYFDKRLYKAEEEVVEYEKKEKKRKRKEHVRKLNVSPEVKEIISILDEQSEKPKEKK